MASSELVCESRISHVTVYARGALVTREVQLPAGLSMDAVDVAVAGITPMAQVGSARAAVEGGRAVVALRSRLVVPAAPASPGPLLAQLRDLSLARSRLEAEREQLRQRRTELAAVALTPALRSRSHRRIDAEARVADALALTGVVGELTAALDARLLAIDEAVERNRRAVEAAELAAAQGRSAERAGAGQPTYTVLVRLAAASEAGGEARALTLSYVVDAARWWPAYTARLSAAGARAEWTLGAFVAQLSGEDWTHVRLALSTADAVHDARLPELPSLRLSRAQPPPRKGYRPPPAGLEAMFRGYDRLVGPAPASTPTATVLLSDALIADRDGDQVVNEVFTVEAEELAADAKPDADERQMTRAGTVSPRMMEQLARLQASATSVTRNIARADMGPPKPQAARERRAEPEMKKSVSRGAPMTLGGVAGPAPGAPPFQGLAEGGGGGAFDAFGRLEANIDALESGAIEPSDAWLDFDSLVMAAPADVTHRGRLVHRAEHSMAGTVATAVNALERMEVPGGLRDPRETRGQFDHRYEARALADVPSSLVPHSITLGVAEAAPTVRLRVVPHEAAEVYREAEMRNPFDTPLLAGPVDVFLDGTLMTSAALAAVDKGGTLALGLGVEERVRAARNARVEENTVGLLGGSSQIDHTVTIDVTSSLGHPVSVQVLDRVPVSDDKSIEVTLLATQPAAEPYDQAERGAPVRGGLRWRLDLAGGAKGRVEFRYRITLPARSEVVGGNRRD